MVNYTSKSYCEKEKITFHSACSLETSDFHGRDFSFQMLRFICRTELITSLPYTDTKASARRLGWDRGTSGKATSLGSRALSGTGVSEVSVRSHSLPARCSLPSRSCFWVSGSNTPIWALSSNEQELVVSWHIWGQLPLAKPVLAVASANTGPCRS